MSYGLSGPPVEPPPPRTVCVVGSGGREHVLASVLARTADVVVSPGNPGIAGRSPEGHTVTCTDTPVERIGADLFVIGPEAPLVDGLADRLRAGDRVVELLVPWARGDVLAAVHREGEIVGEEPGDLATRLQVVLDEVGRARFAEFVDP